MAVALGKRGNAADGHHVSALRVGLSAPLDGVAPLGLRTTAIAGEARLARGVDRPTEYDNIRLQEH